MVSCMFSTENPCISCRCLPHVLVSRLRHGFTRAESDDLKAARNTIWTSQEEHRISTCAVQPDEGHSTYKKLQCDLGGKLGFVFPWQVHFDAFCDEDGEMPNLQMWGPKWSTGRAGFYPRGAFPPQDLINFGLKTSPAWRLTNNSKTCLDSQVFFWDWDLAMFSLFWLFRHVPSLPTQRFQDVSSLISLLIFTKLHGQLRYGLLRYIGHESTLDEAGIWGCRWIMSMGCGSTGCQMTTCKSVEIWGKSW